MGPINQSSRLRGAAQAKKSRSGEINTIRDREYWKHRVRRRKMRDAIAAEAMGASPETIAQYLAR